MELLVVSTEEVREALLLHLAEQVEEPRISGNPLFPCRTVFWLLGEGAVRLETLLVLVVLVAILAVPKLL